MIFYPLIFITLLFVFIAQLLWMQYLPVLGIGPDVVLIAIIFFALKYGAVFGEVAGFICGIFVDIFSLAVFGTHAFILTLIGYTVGKMSHRIDEQSIVVQVLLTLLGVLFQIGIIYLVSAIFMPSALVALKNLIVTPLYTAILAVPIFNFLHWWIKKVEQWSGKMSQN